ncbi:hypothetical protein C922_05151 [Plasmodium inui San Antonio 1]|uniref:Uncharacterized protein n=1 Tax=Plasmodium inui San Antonio 1 TaxID=1237626 RepID=W6ZYN3_9APIC|nr:hypothetical protein C922_05151 [Plasmodium inui San Antonio 1]EUD64463.1 hypothetical protein C922_05151 [Plasmodium inui San Antonio 1]
MSGLQPNDHVTQDTDREEQTARTKFTNQNSGAEQAKEALETPKETKGGLTKEGQILAAEECQGDLKARKMTKKI